MFARYRAKARSRVKAQELRRFLAFWGGDPASASPSPDDVCEYLAHRELTGGNTHVHRVGCAAAGGSAAASTCACPRRLKAASLRSALLALRSAFAEEWDLGGAPYDPLTRSGNPALARRVDTYLTVVTEEQAEAGVVTRKALPVPLAKVRLLSAHLRAAAQVAAVSPAERLACRQDRAWLLLAFFSSVRAGQLGDTRCASTVFTTEAPHPAVLLRWTWGKTLRDGGEHVVRVEPIPEDPLICPVRALREYTAAARLAGWDLVGGHLFSPILPDSGRGAGAGSAKALGVRFKALLARLDIDGGETLHGLRGGGVLHRLLDRRESAASVIERVGWRSPSMPAYYTGLPQIARVLGATAAECSSERARAADAAPCAGSFVAPLAPRA